MKQIVTWLSREPEIEVCVLYTNTLDQILIQRVLNEEGKEISITLDEQEGLIEEIVLDENGLVDEEYFYYLRDQVQESEFGQAYP